MIYNRDSRGPLQSLLGFSDGPWRWAAGLQASVATAVPLAAFTLAGQQSLGLIASLGAFTALYGRWCGAAGQPLLTAQRHPGYAPRAGHNARLSYLRLHQAGGSARLLARRYSRPAPVLDRSRGRAALCLGTHVHDADRTAHLIGWWHKRHVCASRRAAYGHPGWVWYSYGSSLGQRMG